MKTISKHKTFCAVFLLAVGCIIYCLNVFTPLFSDDWHYAFIFGTHQRIDSIGDIFRSQYIHYFDFNGRSIVHFIVQLFDGILGKNVFNVFNALMFVAFLYALTLVVPNRKGHSFKIISVAFILVFLIMTGFKYVFLWLSGSVNYLWVGTVLLVFHYFLERESVPKWSYTPLAILGFLCGWSNEAFVFGLGAAYFIYYMTHRDKLVNHRIYMLAAFYLGACLLVFAPGSVHRALSDNHQTMKVGFLPSIWHMNNVGLLYLVIVIAACKAIKSKKGFISWLKKEQLFIIAIVISFCFILITGVIFEHSRFGIEFFSLIVILRSINWERIPTIPIVIADILILALASYVLIACHKIYVTNQNELAQITDDNCIVLTTQPDVPDFVYRFALDYSSFYTGINTKMYGTVKTLITTYYGVETITFLPADFVKDIKVNQDKYSCYRSFGKLPFYAKKIPSNQEYRAAIIEYKEPSYSSWPEVLHPILSRITGEHKQQDTCGFKTIYLDGQWYVLIDRSFPEQDKSLKRIILEQ